MKVFQVQHAMVRSKEHSGDIDAAHRWGLPGVSCHVCGVTWSVSSCEYPAIDLSHLPEVKLYEEPRAEPLEEFERLRCPLLPLIPNGFVPPPGTEFGPLRGRAWGRFGTFAWRGGATLLVERKTFSQLREAGVQGLVGVKPEIRFRGKKAPDWLELNLEPHALLHRSCLPADLRPPCPACGRQGLKRPDNLIIDAATFPAHVDIFRAGNYTTVILATERFVGAVRQLGLQDDIAFTELPLATS
jgi:uncharacterized double-CXXCG motif protein